MIDIRKLYSVLEHKQIREIPLSQIKTPNRSKRTGFSLNRMGKADIKYPLIIDENASLVDGRHRYFKLLDLGRKKAKVRVATAEDIQSCYVNDDSELTQEVHH